MTRVLAFGANALGGFIAIWGAALLTYEVLTGTGTSQGAALAGIGVGIIGGGQVLKGHGKSKETGR
jgi:hypothetical protein